MSKISYLNTSTSSGPFFPKKPPNLTVNNLKILKSGSCLIDQATTITSTVQRFTNWCPTWGVGGSSMNKHNTVLTASMVLDPGPS